MIQTEVVPLISRKPGNFWSPGRFHPPSRHDRDARLDNVQSEANATVPRALAAEKLLRSSVGVRIKRVRIFGISNLIQDAQDFAPSWKFRKKLHQQSQFPWAFAFRTLAYFENIRPLRLFGQSEATVKKGILSFELKTSENFGFFFRKLRIYLKFRPAYR